MDRHPIRRGLALVLVITAASCRSYEARPLDPAATLARIDRQRRQPETDDAEMTTNASGVTLRRAAAWMLEFGPELALARATYRTALARAQVATPLPNPGLTIGPEYGFGPDVNQNHLVPFGSLSITLPLGGRLTETDRLNAARAEALRIDAVARHRELYLDLRRGFVRLAVTGAIERARASLAQAAARTATSARELVEAGQATAIDVALLELEQGRAEAALISSRTVAATARAELATLVGVQAELFGELDRSRLPVLPTQPPLAAELRDLLIANHPTLARLRAGYDLAEAGLRLEIERQYPDLQIGPSFGGETGERRTTLGLAIGIALPIFDRNQQAVAEAEAAREEARTRFEAAANRALAELDRALALLRLASERRAALEDRVVPQARRNIDLARRSLAAGSGDALRLLSAERSHREVLVELLEARLAENEAWIDLESAVGRPILDFPDQPELEAPPELAVPLAAETAPDEGESE